MYEYGKLYYMMPSLVLLINRLFLDWLNTKQIPPIKKAKTTRNCPIDAFWKDNIHIKIIQMQLIHVNILPT